MTPMMTWAARAAITGLLAAGLPGTAAADETPASTTTDAITQCLVDHGYPPLPAGTMLAPPPGSILVPPSGGAAAPAAPPTGAPTPAVWPPTGTATPAGWPPAGTTSGVGTIATPSGGTGLPCGQLIINNTLYAFVVTVTTTTTNVTAPITAAAGSITTTTEAPATVLSAPLPSAAAPSAASKTALGTPLRVQSSARPTARRAERRRLVRIWLVRRGAAAG